MKEAARRRLVEELGLLRRFDRFNRLLYAHYSSLNWFTKRRRMRIVPRKPENQTSRQLFNESAVGRVRLNEKGEPVSYDARDLLSRVMQHEIDHLMGNTFLDRMSILKRLKALSQIRKKRKSGEWG